MVEYGLLLALIAMVSLAAITAVGHSTSESLTAAADSLTVGESAVTTTVAPAYPTAEAGVKGQVTVTYGYVDGKVVVLNTQMEGVWSTKVTEQKKDLIEIEFKNKKTGAVVKTQGYVKKGELKTKTEYEK